MCIWESCPRLSAVSIDRVDHEQNQNRLAHLLTRYRVGINNQFLSCSKNPPILIAGQTHHFKDAFSGKDTSLMGLPLAFYYGMYAYAGW